MLEYITIGHQYFWSTFYTFVQGMTPLHGGAASGLKIVPDPHCRFQSKVNSNKKIKSAFWLIKRKVYLLTGKE